MPTTFSVSIESDISTTVNISISWNSAFNLVHNVTSYSVVANGGSAASCPLSCDPSSPCNCAGLGIGENITIIFSAINCGDQMGPPVTIIARPRGSHTKSELDKHVVTTVTVLNAYSSIHAIRMHQSTSLYVGRRSQCSLSNLGCCCCKLH